MPVCICQGADTSLWGLNVIAWAPSKGRGWGGVGKGLPDLPLLFTSVPSTELFCADRCRHRCPLVARGCWGCWGACPHCVLGTGMGESPYSIPPSPSRQAPMCSVAATGGWETPQYHWEMEQSLLLPPCGPGVYQVLCLVSFFLCAQLALQCVARRRFEPAGKHPALKRDVPLSRHIRQELQGAGLMPGAGTAAPLRGWLKQTP